jgi:ankyrin repeat protein
MDPHPLPNRYVACDHGHVDMVQLLLSANADVDWAEGDGDGDDGNCAPVRHICRTAHCNVQVLQTLLLAKAYIHESCSPSNVVYDATRAGRADVLHVLADAKADVDARGGAWGSTPLSDAASRGALHMMRVLLHTKADVDKASEVHGYTPMLFAIARGRSDALRLLVSAKADVNVPNSDGETAADLARKYSRDDMVGLLLDAKADVGRP